MVIHIRTTTALLGLLVSSATAAPTRDHPRHATPPLGTHGHAHRHGQRGYVQGLAGRWYRGSGPLPAPRHGATPAYGSVPRPEDADHGHLSTQAVTGAPYRSEVPLPYLRAEPPLAPSPYLGR